MMVPQTIFPIAFAGKVQLVGGNEALGQELVARLKRDGIVAKDAGSSDAGDVFVSNRLVSNRDLDAHERLEASREKKAGCTKCEKNCAAKIGDFLAQGFWAEAPVVNLPEGLKQLTDAVYQPVKALLQE